MTAMDLSSYERAKFALADLLRALPWTSERAERLRALFARLAEDRFNLVVVGRFSRGKSSLMNAILGDEWLPTGIVPLTSVITAVAHGETQGVVLHHEHTSLVTDIALADLAAHITERGNPGNRQRIRVAEVRLPAEILRRGFHFVDTPGLGSSIAENTRTTEDYLPEADALLLVTSFDSPLSAEERRVLVSAHKSGRRVFVVVNKQDNVTEAERQEVLQHLDAQLVQVFGSATRAVFPVSARDGLAARRTGQGPSLVASGLPALEAALIAFLLEGKRQDFLRAMCDRIANMLSEDPQLVPALHQLALLRAQFEDGTGPATPVPAPAAASIFLACPACDQVERAVFDYLAGTQAQLRRDPALRQNLAKRGGLCGPHAWQLAAVAAPREVCTGFATVLEAQAASLRRLAAASPTPGEAAVAVAGLLARPDRCPACAVVAQAEGDALAKLAIQTRTDRQDDGAVLCLPHLALLVALLPNRSSVQAILSAHATHLLRLSEDAQRFALRQDASRTDLGGKDDRDTGTRTLRALIGHPEALTGSATQIQGKLFECYPQ
jgi:small GTP-binding protein